MTTQNNQDWEQKLKDLEVEINPEPQKQTGLASFENISRQLPQWYNSLSTPAKVIVAIVGIAVVFSVLNGVLKLVASLLSITILAVILYGLYKFLMIPRPHQGD